MPWSDEEGGSCGRAIGLLHVVSLREPLKLRSITECHFKGAPVYQCFPVPAFVDIATFDWVGLDRVSR